MPFVPAIDSTYAKVCVWTSLSRTRRQGNRDTMSAREFSWTVRIVLTAVGPLREERAVEKFYWRFCQVAQSGDKNTSFGIFRSVCCGREIVIIDGATAVRTIRTVQLNSLADI